MRFMDGLMSIPAILLAIALMAVVKASIATVIVAITIVEVPRVVRLVRSVVLTIREQAYVEAAVIVGSRFGKHPVPPHPAQHAGAADRAGDLYLRRRDPDRSRCCRSSAPARRRRCRAGATSWPRAAPSFCSRPGSSSRPAWCSPLTVLAINLMGDGLRDMLDPRFARRL